MVEKYMNDPENKTLAWIIDAAKKQDPEFFAYMQSLADGVWGSCRDEESVQDLWDLHFDFVRGDVRDFLCANVGTSTH